MKVSELTESHLDSICNSCNVSSILLTHVQIFNGWLGLPFPLSIHHLVKATVKLTEVTAGLLKWLFNLFNINWEVKSRAATASHLIIIIIIVVVFCRSHRHHHLHNHLHQRRYRRCHHDHCTDFVMGWGGGGGGSSVSKTI